MEKFKLLLFQIVNTMLHMYFVLQMTKNLNKLRTLCDFKTFTLVLVQYLSFYLFKSLATI